MAEVLIRFDAVLRDAAGRGYIPKACGREIDGGRRWEGWIEFESSDGGETLRTPQETVQPSHETLAYWATGLTTAYLEGALERAITPRPVRVAAVADRPAYGEPAPRTLSAVSRPALRPVLDPFEVYAQGEEVLRRELLALDTMHLRTIATAYGLASDEDAEQPDAHRDQLAGRILAGVRARLNPPERR